MNEAFADSNWLVHCTAFVVALIGDLEIFPEIFSRIFREILEFFVSCTAHDRATKKQIFSAAARTIPSILQKLIYFYTLHFVKTHTLTPPTMSAKCKCDRDCGDWPRK